MDVAAIAELLSAITVTAALGFAVLAFVFDLVRSGKSVDKRFLEYSGQRDERDRLLIAERDEWKLIAKTEQKKREEGDERLERITDAFETAYRILSGGKKLPPSPPSESDE